MTVVPLLLVCVLTMAVTGNNTTYNMLGVWVMVKPVVCCCREQARLVRRMVNVGDGVNDKRA